MTPQDQGTSSSIEGFLSDRPDVGMEKPAVFLDRHKLLRILEAMADAVMVFSPEGEVLLCNRASKEILGLTEDAIVGRSIEELFESSEIPALLRRLMASADARPEEVSFHCRTLLKTFLVYAIPIEENGVMTEGVVVFHDITQIRQTEIMRRDFVANVSHELRTPLSAIAGYAETLLDGALEDDEVAEDFIKIIFKHSQRLSNLVRDLLDLSKLESADYSTEFHPVPITTILQKVIMLHENPLIEKHIRLIYQPPSRLPMVLAHEGGIEQIITNLLDNAIKYTPPQGTIRIRLLESTGWLQVDIEDTGIGIEAIHIPRLFERFYRVDKARSRDLGGTGLGLAIVKHIVQHHGGEVWVKSVPGKGSIFSFTLKTVS